MINDPTDRLIASTDKVIVEMQRYRDRLIAEQQAMTFEMPAPRTTIREGRRYRRSYGKRKRRTLR